MPWTLGLGLQVIAQKYSRATEDQKGSLSPKTVVDSTEAEREDFLSHSAAEEQSSSSIAMDIGSGLSPQVHSTEVQQTN